jgi:hypothetical protein
MYICTPNNEEAFKKPKRSKENQKGRLAQLVQSTCLTSRGSLVRTQYLPPKKSLSMQIERLFCVVASPKFFKCKLCTFI